MSYKRRVQINCSRSGKVSSCKVVTDYKNDDKEDVLQTMVDPVMSHLPLLSEDDIVLLNDVLNYVGHCQHLLSVLLSIHLNTMNLGRMGSPFHFGIIHLQDEC